MIKKIPLPVTGVALGLAALGNLIETYSAGLRLVCGAAAALLLILFLVKTVMYPSTFAGDMKNPIMASVFGTFSMALMLLAGYLKPFAGGPATVLWYVGILIHVVLIVYFTKQFILHLNLPKVFASYFIVYVGIAVASVTAPAFRQTGLGTVLFWFAFIMLLVFLVLVTYRYVKVKEVPEPARPLFCIYTAPASLCLAGYMQSVTDKSLAMAGFLAVLSFVIYVIVLLNLPKYLKLKFYPSYAAFTFPFVISAIGLKMTMAWLANTGNAMPWLSWIVLIETVIAAVLVVYTLVRYVMFVIAK